MVTGFGLTDHWPWPMLSSNTFLLKYKILATALDCNASANESNACELPQLIFSDKL